MHNIWTIAKREFGSYFKSPIAYIVITVFLGLSGGLFFYAGFFLAANATMEGYFGQLTWMLAIICPAVAMRLLAEERGSGTIELLLTMPVRDSEVVLGKYLAAVGVLAVALLFTLPFTITVGQLGPLDAGPVLASYFGSLLLGGTYLGVGLLTSAMTRNQVVAFIISLAVCLMLSFMQGLYSLAGPTLGPILQYASPSYQFSKIARGVIELRNVVYYLTFIGALLVLSVQVLESRKWRT